ncbi:uncharacterized protein LOC127710893 [Mytilus californianus]|uniref:uncharacterized protein LOC127710893 n=1 Tax=Mytilus californianus TaxID=6549 RepID=UPI0022452178|nr:uncharacterized protein LOC127710893 [Mytilus californianus]XP_052072822.1 uncharacterized protein LOC127710893 [Mytilus californianus]XP_052072823.1 uncharacterized protein LOC127710893 [Mytilus californianus]
MSGKQEETTRGGDEVDLQNGGSQMNTKHAKGGYDQADTLGQQEDPSSKEIQQQDLNQPQNDLKNPNTDMEDIRDKEFNSPRYNTCGNVGKAVIVSNFMEGWKAKQGDNLVARSYAKNDCDMLEKSLKSLGFQPLDENEDSMVYKNLTKSQFEALYKKAAKETNYRPKGGEGYTCVLFFVMSYGRSGLIQCHKEGEEITHPFVEQKHLQEAFQPQNNHSLALKPKFFIIQTIPERGSVTDAVGTTEEKTTRRIPREADFLTYTSDSYCIHSCDGVEVNYFIKAVVDVLNSLAKDKKNNESAMEIQRVLIRINKKFKEIKPDNSFKIPCVTSSLTKQLILF